MLVAKRTSVTAGIFLGCLCTVALLQAKTAVGQGTQCSIPESCILPQPRHKSNGESLDSLWLELRCHLGCVDQYGMSLNIINGETQWPTIDFSVLENQCTKYQKVRECKEGCLEKSRGASTINRCRDTCFSTCMVEVATGKTQSSCPRLCRKTYCRFGCAVYDTIHGPTNSSFKRHPSRSTLPPTAIVPATPPPVTQATNWRYTMDTRNPLLTAAQNHTQPNLEKVIYSTVAYIIKVSSSSSSGEDSSQYYWQKNTLQAFDLSPFACSAVSISFAVVSKYNMPNSQSLTFSPTASLCVPGVGGYPNQLSAHSISVTYTEDLRAEFVGYAVARVSWTKPSNAQYLTSYTIRVYPDETRCGGTTEVHYTFNNIDKELTEFVLRAQETNGLWRFHCTYLVEVVVLPVLANIDAVRGGYVSTTTELTESFPPFELNCSREWDEEGKFSISVSWAFPSSTQLSHVRRFIITPRLKLKTNTGLVELFDKSSVYPTNGQTKFSVNTQKFTPRSNADNLRYFVEVKAEKSNLYTWRRIPNTQACSQLATPLPPRDISEVSVTDLEYDEENQTLTLDVGVVPSERTHGILEMYEVSLRGSISDCLDCEDYRGSRFLSTSSPVAVDMTLDNNTGNCLFLNVRVFNNYNLSSHWSADQLVSLDEDCDGSLVTPPPTEDEPRVMVYYQEEGSEASKVLEFGCGSSLSLSSEVIEEKLQDIDDRLEVMASRLLGISSGEDSHTQFQAKLERIEDKLDSVLEVLQQQHDT